MTTRTESFGQGYRLTPVDRFGTWLSARQVARWTHGFKDKRVLEAGCGYDARLARTFIDETSRTHLLDVSLRADLKNHPKVTAIVGGLPGSLGEIPDGSQDVVLCLSVLEHLWEPQTALAHFHRLLAPGGVCLLNVPNWRGKWFLEFSAFKLGLSPKAEMDDHKMYYDPRDLWPLLVRAGFAPSSIRCFRHKFGLNTFAVCRKGDA